MSRKKVSSFDYPITITRKGRYLVVGSPDFGFQVSAQALLMDELSYEQIGRAVVSAFERIREKIRESSEGGSPLPDPKALCGVLKVGFREQLGVSAAAHALGISPHELRRRVQREAITSAKTSGGQLRFRLSDLADHLLEDSA